VMRIDNRISDGKCHKLSCPFPWTQS
jgi:hypothetical protein